MTGVREWPLSYINPQAVKDLTDDQLMVIAEYGSETCFMRLDELSHKVGCLLGSGQLVYSILSTSDVRVHSRDFFNYSIGCSVLRKLDDAAFRILMSHFPTVISRLLNAQKPLLEIYNRSVRSLTRNRECCMHASSDLSGNSHCTMNTVYNGDAIWLLSYGYDRKSFWPLPYTQYDNSRGYEVSSDIQSAIPYSKQPMFCRLSKACGGHDDPKLAPSPSKTGEGDEPNPPSTVIIVVSVVAGVVLVVLSSLAYITVQKRHGRPLLPLCLRGKTENSDSTRFLELSIDP